MVSNMAHEHDPNFYCDPPKHNGESLEYIPRMSVDCAYNKIYLSINRFLSYQEYNSMLAGFEHRGQVRLSLADLDALIEQAVEAKNQWILISKGNIMDGE